MPTHGDAARREPRPEAPHLGGSARAVDAVAVAEHQRQGARRTRPAARAKGAAMSAYELAVTLRSRILNDEPDCVAVAVALMEAVLAAGDDLAVHRSLIRKLRTAMAQPGPWLLDLDEDERKEALERELSEARAALKKAESERDVYREVNASIALSNESDLANRLVVAMRELTEARAALAKVTAERDEARKTFAGAFGVRCPRCQRCGAPLVRGPVGGGHFDWLECKCELASSDKEKT